MAWHHSITVCHHQAGTRSNAAPGAPKPPFPLLPGAQPAVAQAQLGMQEDERLRHINRHLVAAGRQGRKGRGQVCGSAGVQQQVLHILQVVLRCAGSAGVAAGNPLRCAGIQQGCCRSTDDGRRSQEAASAANSKWPPQQRPLIVCPITSIACPAHDSCKQLLSCCAGSPPHPVLQRSSRRSSRSCSASRKLPSGSSSVASSSRRPCL